jgi:hypothetical protein
MEFSDANPEIPSKRFSPPAYDSNLMRCGILHHDTRGEFVLRHAAGVAFKLFDSLDDMA